MSTPWSPLWYGFDIESTGVDVFNDRIVTATVVKVEDGAVTNERSWLINPGVDIPEGATAVHGITTAHAREHGVEPAGAVGQITSTVSSVLRAGVPLVVFNAAYDLSLLQVESDRQDIDFTLVDLVGEGENWWRVVDPLALARGIDKNLTRSFKDPKTNKGWVYKLPALCERYKVPFTESHDATADATGAVLLAQAVLKKNPQIVGYGPRQLHVLQRTWHRSNQSSLRAYFDREGIEHDGCDGGWPMHTKLLKEAVNR